MRISEVLAHKPLDGVVTISPEATVQELLALLARHNIGACIVGAGDRMDGIVSERDVVRHLHTAGAEEAVAAPVRQLMSTAVTTCSPEDQLEDLLGVMTERRVRHLPVVDGDTVVGIVSIGDLVKHRIDQLTFERDQLDSYLRQS
ncbi:CBS domain-containing protein [Nocardioides sp.]|uniref:CBS domain-containing protein n=1 Tax=Nocardioides sp. TaxID=35761 RepID=UPI0039E63586